MLRTVFIALCLSLKILSDNLNERRKNMKGTVLIILGMFLMGLAFYTYLDYDGLDLPIDLMIPIGFSFIFGVISLVSGFAEGEKERVARSTPHPTPQPMIQPIQTQSAPHQCPTCRKEVSADFKVCPYCASSLQTSCESCGKPLKPEFKVCPYCARPR
jgi:RNA polymerase subunit RPABC4/transcription elongation factor Spt4